MIVCPLCNCSFEKSILSHIRNAHKMTADQFKAKFPETPMRETWQKGLTKADPRIAKQAKASADIRRGGVSNAALAPGQWSRDHDCCTVCGETSSPHSGKGVCTSCHAKQYFTKRAEKVVWTDEEDAKLEELVLGSEVKIKEIHTHLNSKCYTDVRKRMDELNLEVDPDRKKNLQRDMLPSELTPIEQSVIFGSLLGDGSINLQKEKCYAYRECHGQKQAEYILWKSEMMARWKPKVYYADTTTGKYVSKKNCDITDKEKVYACELDLAYHELWKSIYDKMYIASKTKVISEWWLEKVDGLAVAIWAADDGTRHGSGLKMCTHCFSKDDHDLLKAFLDEHYGTNVTIREPTAAIPHYQLFIPAKDWKSICSQIPWQQLPETMHYKFI